MHIATISSQRQITIPQRMLKQLGVGKKDKLLIEVKDKVLAARPVVGSVVDELAGSMTHLIPEDKRGKSWDDVMAATRKIVAKKLADD